MLMPNTSVPGGYCTVYEKTPYPTGIQQERANRIKNRHMIRVRLSTILHDRTAGALVKL